MTAPDKIWTAPTDGKCHVGFDTKSMNYTIGYTRTDLAQAAVAAAYEAAYTLGMEAGAWDEGHKAEGDYDTPLPDRLKLSALATPDTIAKSDDFVSLPRAEVGALMEAASDAASELASIRHHIAAAIVKKALATLQERMK